VNSKSGAIIYIVFIAVLVFYAFGLLIPAYWNWSVFKVSGSISGMVFLILIFIILIIPGISSIFYRPVSRFFKLLGDLMSALPAAIRVILWIVLPALILYLLRTESYILGDSHSYVGTIVDRTYISPSSYGYSFVLNNLANLFHVVKVDQAIVLMGGISIICGIVFLNFVHASLKLIIENRELRPFLFAAIASSGLIILFTGYTESYPVLAAWLSIYIYYSIKYIRADGNTILLVLIFLAGAFWHLWFIAFLPSLLFILNRRYKIIANKFLIGAAVIYLLGIYLGGQFVRRDYLYISLPPIPNSDTSYTLFSAQHLIDYFNEFIIVGPVLPLLGLVLIFLFMGKLKTAEFSFFKYIAFPAMFMSFIIDPIIGAVRDWDLLSIFGLPLMTIAALALPILVKGNKTIRYFLIPVLLINLFHTGSFITTNKNPGAAVDRVVEVALDDKHYKSDYYDGRKLLPFSTILSNLYGKHEAALKFLERREDLESGDILAKANYYFNQDQFEKACEYYEQVYGQFYLKPLYRYSYGKSLMMTRRPDSAIGLFMDALRDTSFPELYFDLGTSHLLTMHPDSTIKYYELGIRNNPDSIQVMKKYTEVLRAAGLISGAIFYQKRILMSNPGSENARNGLAALFRQAGMADSAAFYRDYEGR